MPLFGKKDDSHTATAERPAGDEPGSFLPRRSRRRGVESFFARVIATGGIVGIGTAIAAILGSQDVAYWITGLVVATASVIVAAFLWSSRTL
jgi:peptidoglycan/LPS O-acetylase OafA/YrhL